MRAKAASTSATPSDGPSAAEGNSRSAAQPTPIWRWRSSPERNATAIAASSGDAARSASARIAILPPRAEVEATPSDARTRSASSMPTS